MAAAALTERYRTNLHGVLSCYDRIIITGTLPGACYAGGMLVPMGSYFLLRDFAHVSLELHPLMLALAYAGIGWTIGTRFDRQVLALCLGSLPMVLASTLTLIVLCAAVGAALVQWAGIDPLTAYLATSPGGVDVVAIIAASTPVDLAFVVSMQVLRLLLVLATGPLVAHVLSRSLSPN